MRTCVVVGGGGFLGRHLVEDLLERGWKVRVFDIRKSFEADDVEFFIGDLCNAKLLEQCFCGADVVFHTASPPPSSNDRTLFYRVNVEGSKVVIQACKEQNVKCLVLTSSASVVYSGADISNGTEQLPYAAKPIDYYTETKILQEKVILAAHSPSLRTIAVRPHGIFGPRDPLLLPTTGRMAQRGKLKFMIGSGQNVVDFTYVRNVTHGHVLAAENLLQKEDVGGKAYFVTNAEPVLFWNFMGWICEDLGYPKPKICLPYYMIYGLALLLQLVSWCLRPIYQLKPTFTPMRVALAGTHHFYSCERAQRVLGYKPKISVRDALRITTDSYPELKKKI